MVSRFNCVLSATVTAPLAGLIAKAVWPVPPVIVQLWKVVGVTSPSVAATVKTNEELDKFSLIDTL